MSSTGKNTKFNLLGVSLDLVSRTEAIEKIDRFFDKKSQSFLTTTNIEFIMISHHDDEFKNILNKKTSLNLIDGLGISWAVGILKSWKPKIVIIEQIYIFLQWIFSIILMPISLMIFKKYADKKSSGSDLAWDIVRYAAQKNKKLFLLGYKKGLDPNSAQKASLKFLTDIYNLNIVGAHSGTDSVAEEKEIVEIIKKSSADILMIGMGSPRQEKWLDRNLKLTGCKIGIGLGGTFDFIAGIQNRAPRWIQKIGFEWLYRLFQNPRRFKRQISSIPYFLYLVLIERFK